MGMKRLHRRSDLKRTGFSAGGENPRSIGFILREIVFSGSHRRRKGRVAAIYRDLQVVGKCYRLVGGEEGIRTLGTGSCSLRRGFVLAPDDIVRVGGYA